MCDQKNLISFKAPQKDPSLPQGGYFKNESEVDLAV